MSSKPKYKRAALVVKPDNAVVDYLEKTIDILTGFGVEVVPEDIAAHMVNRPPTVTPAPTRKEIGKNTDIILVVGGDGTLLSVAVQAMKHNIPVAGFNLGKLGFLTELKKEHLEQNLHDIFYGHPRIARRKMLEINYKGDNYAALNDVVTGKGNIARMIEIQLDINGNFVAKIAADGLIISTPTGSTAYSLSAGGPIVNPRVNGLVITPICAHSLTFRPLVIPDNSRIKVTLLSDTESFITVDGQQVLPLQKNDFFETHICPDPLQMVESGDICYYKLLNEKLKWGL